jgi:hypothetical protein
MDEAAQNVDAFDTARRTAAQWGCVSHRDRDLKIDGPMGPASVVVLDIGGQDPLEMTAVPDQYPIQTLGAGVLLLNHLGF